MATLVGLTVADDPGSWRDAGFAVDRTGTCRIGAVDVRCTGPSPGDGAGGIVGWTLADLTGEGAGDGPIELDGIPTTFVGDAPPAPSGASHPNGTLGIDHVVVLSPDPERTVAALGRVGLEPRRTRTTETYGAPMRQTFFRAGEVVVELIGPEEGPWGDDPASFFGLAHTVADLDATSALLGPALGRVKDAVQPGRRIATLRHRDVGMSVATAFMSPPP